MRLLLDTHVFIWWDSDPDRLTDSTLSRLRDPDNTLLLSLVSVWEIQIKQSLGKLSLNRPLPELIESQRKTNGIEILPIELSHIYALGSLPGHHRDPFDRLLIAQAIAESIPIVTVDPVFARYPIKVPIEGDL